LRESDKYPDEVAAMISYIPTSKKESTEEEKKESDEDEEELAPGEFIFLVDRSGSMNGTRMNLAIEALKIFLQSLPEKSFFNIISFGSGYNLMFPQSVEYNDKNLHTAKVNVSSFTANMGGTEILNPLVGIMSIVGKETHPRHIFMLTDGAVGQPESVVNYIRINNHKT